MVADAGLDEVPSHSVLVLARRIVSPTSQT